MIHTRGITNSDANLNKIRNGATNVPYKISITVQAPIICMDFVIGLPSASTFSAPYSYALCRHHFPLGFWLAENAVQASHIAQHC
jgi:hypothetical protein